MKEKRRILKKKIDKQNSLMPYLYLEMNNMIINVIIHQKKDRRK